MDSETAGPDPISGPGSAGKTLAERLDLLFKATHPADEPEVGYNTVVEAMANSGGPSITPTYLYMLRTGRRFNPRADLIQALARYFKVPTGYFFDDDVAAEYGDQLRLLAAIRDSGTVGLALRAEGLSPSSRAALSAILDKLRVADGLPAARDEDAAVAGGTDSTPSPGGPSEIGTQYLRGVLLNWASCLNPCRPPLLGSPWQLGCSGPSTATAWTSPGPSPTSWSA